jgi:hypothetical protein
MLCDAAGSDEGPACFGMPGSASAEWRSPMLIAGLLTGILLFIVGSIMDSHERAHREREWRERWRK